jgi:predicted NUDIX family NTP pyrophosphohydrolase
MARKDDISAGLLAYRRGNQIEVLLAHPGGPYWARKDDGAWTIPKGLVRPDDLLTGALR